VKRANMLLLSVSPVLFSTFLTIVQSVSLSLNFFGGHSFLLHHDLTTADIFHLFQLPCPTPYDPRIARRLTHP
jgi:hypothetical protein